jgi:hypothetical protein
MGLGLLTAVADQRFGGVGDGMVDLIKMAVGKKRPTITVGPTS